MNVGEKHGIDLIDNLSTNNDYGLSNRSQILAKKSRESIESLRKIGLPGLKHEEYKYFPAFRKITPKLSLHNGKSSVVDPEIITKNLIDDPDGDHLIFSDGIFQEKYSKIRHSEAVAISTSNNPTSELATIQGALNQKIDESTDPFVLLNVGFLQNVSTIEIAPNTDNVKLYIYNFFTGNLNNDLINSQLLLHIGDNSNLSITEIGHSTNNEFYFDNFFTEVHVGENASLELTKTQEFGKNSLHIHNTHIHQKANSKVYTNTFSLQGGMVRNNLVFHINDSNCESYLNGLYYISGKNLIDNHTTVDHKKPHTYSNELYKGIIDDQGKGVFNGKIFVRPDAQKTNAFQSNKNIVMTDTATINTKPQLEIWADDVKCSHGATTGQIDEEQLFYMRSRGISYDNARILLLHAFAYEIIEKISNEKLRDKIEKKVNKRLGFNL